MKKLMIFAAATAATAASLSIVSPAFADAKVVEAPAEAGTKVNSYDHIKTTLHGEAGPLVVLIPGMSTPGESWDEQVEALKGQHRLLVVHTRGFEGERGTANESDGALDGIVENLSTDLKARGLGPATIVGHSMGGLAAMMFGLAHPDQASRLLIVDSLPWFATIFGSDMTMEQAKVRADGMREMMLNSADAMRAMGKTGTDKDNGALDMSVKADKRIQIANWTLKSEPLAVAQLVHEDVMTDLRADIADLKMPVTVLHMANGEYAEMAKKRYSTDYAALKQARIVPVDGTGHFIHFDHPALFRAELSHLISKPVQ